MLQTAIPHIKASELHHVVLGPAPRRGRRRDVVRVQLERACAGVVGLYCRHRRRRRAPPRRDSAGRGSRVPRLLHQGQLAVWRRPLPPWSFGLIYIWRFGQPLSIPTEYYKLKIAIETGFHSVDF